MKTNWSEIEIKGKEAHITVNGYIGNYDIEGTSKEADVIKQMMQDELKAITNMSVDTIYIDIDSPGGDINHALAMYNAIKSTGAYVETNFTGFSASAATVLGMVGDKITSPWNLLHLVHEARGATKGVATTMETYARELKKYNNIAATIYTRGDATRKEALLELMARNGGEGEWLPASELMEYGLIDELIEPVKAAAYVDINERLKALKVIELPLDLINKLNNNEMMFKKKMDVGMQSYEGSYELADGGTIVVDANNMVIELKAAEAVATAVEDPEKEEDKEAVVTQVAEMLVEFETKMEAKLAAIKMTGSPHTPERGVGVAQKVMSANPHKMATRLLKDEVVELRKNKGGL